jgi:hypothetical protein
VTQLVKYDIQEKFEETSYYLQQIKYVCHILLTESHVDIVITHNRLNMYVIFY